MNRWFPPLAWAFEFGSAGMLALAVAALAPFVLHWRRRPRVPQVPWAAAFLLEAAINKSRGQGGLARKALLATRTIAAIVLTVALADPRATTPGAVDAGLRATHVVFLLDNTLSMATRSSDASNASGATRFDQALAVVKRRTTQARDGDRFSLVVVASPAGRVIAEPTRSRESLLRELDRLRPSAGAADFPAAIEAVIEAVDDTRAEDVEIVVVSDMQAVDWRGDGQRPSVADALGAAAGRSRVVIQDVAGVDEPMNLAITRLTLVDDIPVADSPVAVEATVTASATAPAGQATVSWRVDGVPQGETVVDVAPGAASQASWSFVPQGAAWRVVEARLADDASPGDNRRWLVFRTGPPRLVACVADGSSKATSIVAALASEPGDGVPWRLETMVPPEYARRADEFDAAVFCDVAAFAAGDAAVVRRRIRSGAGALFLIGRDAPPEHYNRLLGAGQGAGRALPVDLTTESPRGEFRLDPLGFRHELVVPIAGFRAAGLTAAPAWRYLRAIVPDGVTATRAIDWSSGDPAIVSAVVGDGRVCAAMIDVTLDEANSSGPNAREAWTALAAWPCWPPLAHEMLAWTIRIDRDEGHGVAGCPLVVPLRGRLPDDDGDYVWAPVDFEANGAPRTDLESERAILETTTDRRSWTIPPTPIDGPIVLRSASSGHTSRDEIVALAALNIDPAESRLTRWPVDERPAAWRASDSAGAVSAAGPQDSWAPWLLVGALLLLVAETVWSSWITTTV